MRTLLLAAFAACVMGQAAGQNAALPGSVWCWWHDPALADARKEARSRGGRARHGRKLGTTSMGDPVEIHSLEDVSRLIVEEINMARGLEKSISRARRFVVADAA